MFDTLRISLAIRSTYQVNSILYCMQQIPILNRLLPNRLYQIQGLKHFASILSGLLTIVKLFGGKFLYFLFLAGSTSVLFPLLPSDGLYLHTVLLLTVIGMIVNCGIIDPDYDPYYAIILMRMNARSYTLTDFGCRTMKIIVGFLPFSLFFGLSKDVPLWFCLLLPFCVAGGKLFMVGLSLRKYEKDGKTVQENLKLDWTLAAVLLVVTYALPFFGLTVPTGISMALLTALIPLGLIQIPGILSFPDYRQMNQQVLSSFLSWGTDAVEIVQNNTHDMITLDSRSSSKHGFEYLNELFIRRHKKLLWSATWKISVVCLALAVGSCVLLEFFPAFKDGIQDVILHSLPYFSFILYFINRGTSFTQALFINCDRSLLTYSFYKQPDSILRLFRIRLREITKINLVPAAVIGLGLDGILLICGGGNWIEYLVILVSILSMSLFFSIHYLTLYYLLQPFNAGTELKSGTYQAVTGVTYLGCCFMMQLRLPATGFGLLCSGFCVAYSVIACILVYRIAPRTFRIRT